MKSSGPPPEAPPGTLSDVRFTRGANDSARITLTVQSDVAPQLDQQSARAWVLKFPSLHVASGQERSLDTAAYGTVVRLVSTYQGAADVAHVVANLTGPAESDLKREGNTWVWEIRGTGPRPLSVAKRQAAASGTAPQTAGFAAQAASLARFSPHPIPRQSQADFVGCQRRRYHQRFTPHFRGDRRKYYCQR